MNSDLSMVQCDAGKQLHTHPYHSEQSRSYHCWQKEEKKTEGLWRDTLIARACAAYSGEIKIQGSSLILKAHIALISCYGCLKCMHYICMFESLQAHMPAPQRTQTKHTVYGALPTSSWCTGELTGRETLHFVLSFFSPWTQVSLNTQSHTRKHQKSTSKTTGCSLYWD